MKTFELEIVTPDGGPPPLAATSLDVPAEGGRLTVLPGHQPLIAALRAGRTRVVGAAGARADWLTGPGTLTVAPDGVCLLVRSAAPAPAEARP